MAQQFFKRNEKKYLLTQSEYEVVRRAIERYMEPDKFFESDIHTIYFDTEHDDLIIQALEGPDYKYKVRVRSYGVKGGSQTVFFEIKSKLDGTVYKRRAELSIADYERYLRGELAIDGQVMREFDHLFRRKALLPKVFITYWRQAYRARDTHSDLRITFDTSLRSRTHDVSIHKHDECDEYFSEPTYIMEVKTRSGMPLWLVAILAKHRLYPTSFSKYGRIYQKMRTEEVRHAY